MNWKQRKSPPNRHWGIWNQSYINQFLQLSNSHLKYGMAKEQATTKKIISISKHLEVGTSTKLGFVLIITHGWILLALSQSAEYDISMSHDPVREEIKRLTYII